MSEWKQTTLGELAHRITKGTTPSKDSFGVAGVSYVKVESMSESGTVIPGKLAKITRDTHENLKRSQLQEHDVLFSIAGTIGRVASVPREILPANTNQAVAIIRPDLERVEPRYLRYALSARHFSLNASSRTVQSVQANLSLSQLSSMVMPMPIMAEQRAIAEVLGALDDKIAANSRLAENADEYLRARYKELVRVKTEPRRLLDLVDITFGEAFAGENFSEPGDGRPLIRIRDLKTFAPQIWTTEERKRETVVEPGDVVVGMDAEFRATTWQGPSGLLNQRVCRVRSRRYNNAIVRELLRAPLAAIESEKSATTVIHLNKSDLERAACSVPTDTAVETWGPIMEDLYQTRVTAIAQNRILAEIRDTLLPKLVSGKLQISATERIVSRSV